MATSKALATAKKAAPRRAPAVVEQGEYVISGIPSVAQVKEVLTSGSKFYLDDDGSAETGSFLNSVLERAQTPEALFAEYELLSVKNHLGEVFILEGVDAVRPSEFAESELGVFLIVSAIDSEGEVVKLAIGAKDPFAKIVALHEMGAFPWRVSFEKSEKATKKGFFPVKLVNRQATAKGGQRVDF